MRIWDISPGYLNRQSLLGEHRELHGIVSIIVNGKKGYSRHPETLRWVGFGWALRMRHRQLACEMALRGYTDRSPVTMNSKENEWPGIFIDNPYMQLQLLREKYADRENGRIPLPGNPQQLWSQHKYSVLARNQKIYRKIGRSVAGNSISFSRMCEIFTLIRREKPSSGGIRNAVQHMWGYVSGKQEDSAAAIDHWSVRRLLTETQKRAMCDGSEYIRSSTALSDLMVWLPDDDC